MNEGTHKNELTEKGSIGRERCPEPILSEAGCDYTLPDYLPEIRKILSVRAEVLPGMPFEGGAGVEFGGSVLHHVIYADGEGRLQALPLHADYSLSAGAGDGELTGMFADTAALGTVCRLGGPRKISLRTRLESRLRLFTRESVEPDVRGMGSEADRASLETLSERVESERSCPVRSPEIALTATMRLDGTGEGTRAVYGGGGVLVNECRTENGGITARGEVWLRVLCTENEGSPYVLRERVPFDTHVECEGVREGDACVGHGRLLSCDLSITLGEGEENGAVTADLSMEVECCATTKQSCVPTVALYSTAYEMACEHRDLTYQRPLGVAMGHYTVSGRRARTECDAEEASTVVDAHGRVELGTVTSEGGRAVVSGRVLCDLIFTEPPAGEGLSPTLLSAPIECPFRIETDLRIEAGAIPSFVCHADLIGARGRIEEKTLSVDCEIALWVRAFEKKETRILASAEPAGALPAERRGCVRVVYPQKGDTLFSLAARYHKKRATLASENGLSEAALANATSAASLDGVHHLLIEE